MNLHLAEIAKIVAPGAHAVLLLDQAGCHLSMRLVVPSNITIIALPPKCPELNPVENVWQGTKAPSNRLPHAASLWLSNITVLSMFRWSEVSPGRLVTAAQSE